MSHLVNVLALAPQGSRDEPDFQRRGYYVDKPFACRDCGKAEIWTAAQQKWWYEIAKGGRMTMAIRCRSCRRAERARAAEHRRKSVEGKERKARSVAVKPG